MDPLTRRVALRWAFRYVPKETKEHRVENLRNLILEHTGLSKGLAEGIADAFIRGRDVNGLSIQKSWPIQNSIVHGPNGTFDLREVALR
jgi:hypothetical protein